MRFCCAALMALACSILPATGQADGLTFKLEGGRGIIGFNDTGLLILETGIPPSDTEFGTRIHGMRRGP